MVDIRRGLIIVNTGPGKGKTTAAMGTALRAVGQGMRVLMLQFLKGSWHYGELDAVQAFGDKFVMKQMGRGFVKVGAEKPDPEDVRMVEDAWSEAEPAFASGHKTVRPEVLWVKCENCRQITWKTVLEDNMNVCPKCDKHFRLDARARLALLMDENEYEILDANISSTDPLKFVDLKPYSSRLKQAQKDTGLKDAVINANGKLMGRPVVASVMEYAFIGGSIGAVVGEAITRAVERAVESKNPLIIVSASGGARMMEGVVSLMQLAKISAALAQIGRAHV